MTKLKATVSFDLDFSSLLTQEQIKDVTKRLQEGSVGTPVWEGCKQAAGGDTEKFLELVSRTWVRTWVRHSFNVPAEVTFHKEQPKPVRPTLPKDWWVQVGTREEVLEVLTLLQGNYRWRSELEALEHVPTDCIALGVYQGRILYQSEDLYGPASFHDDGCIEVTVDRLRRALGSPAFVETPVVPAKEPLQALPTAWYIEGITAEQLQELQGFKLLQELGVWISGEPFNERGLLRGGGRLQFKGGEFAHFGTFKYGAELSFNELLDYCKRNEVRAIELPEKWHVHLTSQGQLESLQCSEHLRNLGDCWLDGKPFHEAAYVVKYPVLAYDGSVYHCERNADLVRDFNGESHEFTFEELRGLLGDE